jgi:hypothetical protein
MGKKQIVLVLAEPREGQEEEFNRYYEDVHLDEVLETTGWKLAQRFKLVDQAGKECPQPYLAFYETEADPDKSAIEIMNETKKNRVQSDSLNKKTAGVWVFEEIGPTHGDSC